MVITIVGVVFSVSVTSCVVKVLIMGIIYCFLAFTTYKQQNIAAKGLTNGHDEHMRFFVYSAMKFSSRWSTSYYYSSNSPLL